MPRLMDSIEAQENADEVELVVVDDCSPDDTQQVVEAWMAQPRTVRTQYVRLARNGGPGRARNEGARAARAPVVAFTDSDCVAAPGWCKGLLDALHLREGYIGVGGKVLPLHTDTQIAKYFHMNQTLEPLRSENFPIGFLVTCNCCYVREELLAAGGFMEDIRSPGGEDVAASIRLRKRGWRFNFTEDALIYHDFRDDLRAFCRTWFNYGFGCAFVACRLLTDKELIPERNQFDVEHYWGIWPIRPTVTGLRSFFTDLGMYWWMGGKTGYSVFERVCAVWLRPFDRLNYYRGWRAGISAWEAESGRRSVLRLRGAAAWRRPEEETG